VSEKFNKHVSGVHRLLCHPARRKYTNLSLLSAGTIYYEARVRLNWSIISVVSQKKSVPILILLITNFLFCLLKYVYIDGYNLSTNYTYTKTSRRCICTCKFSILQAACILPHYVLNSNNIHLSRNTGWHKKTGTFEMRSGSHVQLAAMRNRDLEDVIFRDW
jgi:hypothetical protein